MDNIYVLEEEFPIYFLDCKSSFENLNEQEKQYASSLIKAGWYGALINLVQCSPESPGLFIIAQKLFRTQSSDEITKLIKSLGYTDTDANNFLNYFVMIYDNMGNYRSFGDSKFIPRLEESKLHHIITSTTVYNTDNRFKEIYERIKSSIFSLTIRNKQMGLGDNGISTYYSYNCTIDDAKLIQVYMDENRVSAYNTRVFKTVVNGSINYEIRQASSEKAAGKLLDIKHSKDEAGVNRSVTLINGDYREIMALMVEELIHAKQAALNERERQMLECYIDSFRTGSIDSHKDGSRHWIFDKGPVVENYIGFIETYRDPLGVRGEFEAFIAVVNREMSGKFERLVQAAPEILTSLPWPKQYEKDKFLLPDFTSLDIINFASSGMPVGINIPNYDEIRQNEGFKNVSLGNVLKARFKDPKSNFIDPNDRDLFVKLVAEAFEVQVGLHELIGHGSGKLFFCRDGEYNFDLNGTPNIAGNGSITSWYRDTDTWDSIFTYLASPFEECRAECVGLYLCSLPSVAQIFGHVDPSKASDIVYVNWLSMLKSSLISMEFYTPAQQKWRQAHCQARFVILQVLLEAGNDLVRIEKIIASDGEPDLIIHLDQSKIECVGRPAIGNFLKHLQYYKSTANFTEGHAFFNRYAILNDQFLDYHKIVLKRKLPRGGIVQCVINEKDGVPEMCEYPSTSHGMIQSFIDRYSGSCGEKAEEALYQVWKRDISHFY